MRIFADDAFFGFELEFQVIAQQARMPGGVVVELRVDAPFAARGVRAAVVQIGVEISSTYSSQFSRTK